MKKLYPIFVVLILFAVACKKDRIPQPTAATPVNSSTPFTSTTPVTPASTVLTATQIFPSEGAYKGLVTITGTNFGTSVNDITVLFGNGKDTAFVQSVTPTEIKVTVPKTVPGTITVKTKDNQTAVTPVYNYKESHLSQPYTQGSIWFYTQKDIDEFAALNKGRKLEITGGVMIYAGSGNQDPITSLAGLSVIQNVGNTLSITSINIPDAGFLKSLLYVGGLSIVGCGFNDLNLSSLLAGPETFTLRDMQNLKQIDTRLKGDVKEVNISGCPQLTNFNVLNGINTADVVKISTCPQLRDLNFLNNVNSIGTLDISTSPSITNLDFLNDINSINMMSIANVAASSIKFNKLTKAGTIAFNNNSNLSVLAGQNLTGATTISVQNSPLLTKLSFPALTSLASFAVLTVTSTAIGDLSGFGALQSAYSITLNNNSKLTSLNGLQNIKTLTAAVITNNTLLTDLCPFKQNITRLSTSTYTPISFSNIKSDPKAALTFANNGALQTVADAVNAAAVCP